MLTSGDLANIRAAMAEVRTDNEVSIALRRGETPLTAQMFRFAQKSSSSRSSGAGGQTAGMAESTAPATLLGAIGADVQIGDRFTHGGKVWRVIYVRPDQRTGTMCDLEATA
jgi:hypothetical protein